MSVNFFARVILIYRFDWILVVGIAQLAQYMLCTSSTPSKNNKLLAICAAQV